MNGKYTYLVNKTNDGAVRFCAPDKVTPALVGILLREGYRCASREEYHQAVRNARLADMAILRAEE